MTKPAVSQPRKYLTRMMVCPHPDHEIKCSWVEDGVKPQAAVYSDGTYYCFGCGARGKVDGGKT